VVVLNPLLLMHLLSAAHNDALMLGLLVAGLAWAMQGRFLFAVVAISLAGAIKAPALLGIPFAIVAVTARPTTRPSWPRLVATALLVPFAVFTAANLVAGVGWGWAANLNAADRVRIWLTPTTALGRVLAQAAALLGMGDRSDATIGAARAAAAVATALVVLWLLVTARRRSAVRGLGLALLTVALLAPVLQPWYLLWGLVLLAASGLRPVEERAAVAATTAMVVYSAVNTNATAVTHVALKEGPAAALALFAGLALFVALRRPHLQRLSEPLPTS
jgi:alpha-1,6-mannosyltransferase